MPGFYLSWSERCIEICEPVSVGRDMDCQIVLEDPMASRRHACVRVVAGELWLDDLGSRNGVFVNGQRVVDRHCLAKGDVIKIGNQEIRVMVAAVDGGPDGFDAARPTKRFEAFGVVGQLADKALALGHGEEAERLLSGVMEQLLVDARAGLLPSEPVLEQASLHAVKLLRHTGHGEWLTWLVRVYSQVRKPWPSVVIDELYEAARSCVGYDRQGLGEYCSLITGDQLQLGPAERFQVRRIQGLERVLSAL